MRNYAINNIISYAGDLFYIGMLNKECIRIENTNIKAMNMLRRTDECFLDDVELSDWFFNQLFDDKRSVDTWIIAGRYDTPEEPLYCIVRVIRERAFRLNLQRLGRMAHQPPGPHGQHGHEHDGQVDGGMLPRTLQRFFHAR